MEKTKRILTEEQKVIVITSIVSISLFVLSIPCFFFNLMNISLGLLLGMIIGLCNYVLLVKQVMYGLSISKPKLKAAFNYLLRFLIYALGIALAVILDKYGFKVFNVFAVFGGYFVNKIVLVIVALK